MITLPNSFLEAINDRKVVSGGPHAFYKYPARFSPDFAKEAIRAFSQQGDVVLDPFMGGGTTLLEAKLLGRHAIGFDISSLAHFISRVKVTPISNKEFRLLHDNIDELISSLNCHNPVRRPEEWISAGYQRNLSNKRTWPIRKLIEIFVGLIEAFDCSQRLKDFLRSCLLKSAQWALDSRKIIPSASDFREKLRASIMEMAEDSRDSARRFKLNGKVQTLMFNRPASEIHRTPVVEKIGTPKLVLTSPPYPGIHVLYHRWQVLGRKETPAPFWIANCLDGQGLSYYTLGSRRQQYLTNYFNGIHDIFSSIQEICSTETIIVQMLAFSNPDWQLPKYLDIMELAGLEEVVPAGGRPWREVPNRKWYAQQKGRTFGSQEVVLIHRLIS